MESAIPDHLRTERTRTRRIPDDYVPPYPSHVARFKPSVKRVIMAYFGVQFDGAEPSSARAALDWIKLRFETNDGPTHWDKARYIDEAGYTNIVCVGYWDDHAKFTRWFPNTRATWTHENAAMARLGRYAEVLSPGVEGYETLFSSLGCPEGVAVLADAMSTDIQEHAYWGGMRDRIPKSQTDALTPAGAPTYLRDGPTIRVIPAENICLIRSGQDWSDTDSDERAMYVNDVEPVLREGMMFLRDSGNDVGCYVNRYMVVLDGGGKAQDKSYGMSWWKSLAALERWAESHPTHVAIFGAAMRYLMKLGPAAKLRLYHEVTVARADEQFFEYFQCHDRTGMLKSVKLD